MPARPSLVILPSLAIELSNNRTMKTVPHHHLRFLLLLTVSFLAISAAATFFGDTAVTAADVANADSITVPSDDGHTPGETSPASSVGILGNLATLLMLVLLQVVLGFDNLLYISLESKRAPEDKQKSVRFWGIVIAIALRIVLLIVLVNLIKLFKNPWFGVPEFLSPWAEGNFNGHSLIVLFGGAFIVYTATKEVMHMMRLEHDDHHADTKPRSVQSVVFWIVLMNVVFSFDSILSAMALTETIWVMATAIVIGGLMMIFLADTVSSFLKKNRMYEVLGLFILFIVGIMLLSEGGHLAHLKFFGQPVVPMTKATFYFVLAVLVMTDIVQSRYQKEVAGTGRAVSGVSRVGRAFQRTAKVSRTAEMRAADSFVLRAASLQPTIPYCRLPACIQDNRTAGCQPAALLMCRPASHTTNGTSSCGALARGDRAGNFESSEWLALFGTHPQHWRRLA